MFCFDKKPLINKDICNYIKEKTNMSLEKYKNKNNVKFNIDIDNDNDFPNKPNNNLFLLLPFVSLVSFLAGYRFSFLFNKITN